MVNNSRFMFVVLTGLLLSAVTVFAAPVLLVDQGHEQRFVIEKDEQLQLSSFAAVMKQEGFDVRSSKEPLTEAALKGVSALIISGPFKSLEPAEVEAVARFIEQGGRLSAMLHIGSPLSGILHRLEVDFTNYVLGEQENLIDNDFRNFKVKPLAASPLFDGLEHFSVYGAWALTNTAPSARLIAATSPRGWVDLNGDKMLSKGDVVQAFGVVVEGTHGAGRFVVFGDDALFQNKFLDTSNALLARNLARWLK